MACLGRTVRISRKSIVRARDCQCGMQCRRDGGHAPWAHRAWRGDAQNEAKGAERRHVLPRVPWLRPGGSVARCAYVALRPRVCWSPHSFRVAGAALMGGEARTQQRERVPGLQGEGEGEGGCRKGRIAAVSPVPSRMAHIADNPGVRRELAVAGNTRVHHQARALQIIINSKCVTASLCLHSPRALFTTEARPPRVPPDGQGLAPGRARCAAASSRARC